MDDKLVQELALRLYELREERSEDPPGAESLNELIADVMNGLETLFIIINVGPSQNTTPQANRSTFVSVSNPNKPKVL